MIKNCGFVLALIGRFRLSETRIRPLNQLGFTLVEVLVALAIFALCAMVLSAQSTTTLNNRQHLIEQQIALWVAKDTLVEQRIKVNGRGTEKASPLSARQIEKQAGLDWQVNLTIEPTSNNQLTKVRVKVSRADNRIRRDNHAAQLTTFIEQL